MKRFSQKKFKAADNKAVYENNRFSFSFPYPKIWICKYFGTANFRHLSVNLRFNDTLYTYKLI